MMDWDILWKAAGVILPALAVAYSFVVTRRKDLDVRLEAGHKRMDRHEGRISRLEQTVSAMPGKDDTHRLEITLAEMAGDMRAIRAAMDGMRDSLERTESIVGRHEDYLREKH